MNMHATFPSGPENPERIRDALVFIDPDLPNGDWVSVGQAINNEHPDETGFEVWHAWSAGGAKYAGEKDCRARWRTFRPNGGITINSLFRRAKDAGWSGAPNMRPVPVPPEQTRARQEARAKAEAKADSDKAEKQRKAAQRAATILEAASGVVEEHPYAQAKGGVDFGKHVRRGEFSPRGWVDALLVPIYDDRRELVSLEAINVDGEKWSLPGGRRAGCIYPLAPFSKHESGVVLIAEGAATAAACMAATGEPAVCAFSANNLKAAARLVRTMRSDARIVVVADRGAEEFAKTAAQGAGGTCMELPASLPDKSDAWDLWARDGGAAELKALVDGALAPAEPLQSSENDREPEDVLNEDENGAFRVLGFDRKTIYLYGLRRRQVVETSLNQLTKPAGLLELAPLEFWEMNFGRTNGGIDCPAAANWIHNLAMRRGIFDPARTRGRGAWRDSGRNVFHHGDHLTVDGEQVELGKITSSYAYEGAASIPLGDTKMMTAQEGGELVRAAGKFRWKNPGSGLLVAGWIFLAPICGALPWRPHIWITGAPGAGKSTFLSRYLTPLVQERWMLLLQGNSTEAGIRQTLKSDARPVLIDEFEANTKRDHDRIESVLTMIRQASSDNDAIVARGTTHGTAQSFAIRSMFCLASVGVLLNRGTDRDRVTVLELKTGDNPEWPELEKQLGRFSLDRTLSERLFARALGMLPTIHETVDIFTRMTGKHFGRQRDGDQYGTLLAGAWCLQHDRVPEDYEVELVLQQLDFGEMGAGEAVDEDDSQQALSAVMGSPVKLDSHVTRTVAQLVRMIVDSDHPLDGDPQKRDAVQALGLVGIKVSENETPRRVLVARGHSQLVRMVETTPYAAGLVDRLARVPGAERSSKKSPPEKVRFAGQALRYVSLPLSECLSE